MAETAANLIFRFRWWLFALCVAISGLLLARGGGEIERLSAQVAALETPPPEEVVPQSFDSRREIWFPSGHEGLVAYEQLQTDFVSQDTILVGLESHDPDGVFSVGALTEVARLTTELERIPYVRNVRSLNGFPWIRRDRSEGGDALVVSDLFEKDPKEYTESERIERMAGVLGAERARAVVGDERWARFDEAKADPLGEPRLFNNLVSADAQKTIIMVDVLLPHPSPAALEAMNGEGEERKRLATKLLQSTVHNRVAERVEALVAESSAYPLHVTGLPVTEHHFNKVGEQDMAYVLLMFAIIALGLVVIFRGITGPLLTLTVIALSMAGMMGFIFGIGDLLNNMTAVAPIIMVVVSVADSVHLLATYRALRPSFTDKKSLARECLRRTIVPIALTSATTAVGFASLSTSSVLPISTFGYTVAFGTMLAFFISISLVPGVLALLPLPKKAGAAEAPPPESAQPEARWAGRLVDWSLAHRKTLLLATLALTSVCVIGAFRVRVSSDVRLFFADGDPVMADLKWFEDNLGGYGDLEIIFQGPKRTKTSDGPPIAEDIRFLARVSEFEERIEKERKEPESLLNLVADISSPLDILRKMHQVQNGARPEFYRLPTESDVPESAKTDVVDIDPITGAKQVIPGQSASTMVAQYYLQYENGARPTENLSTTITPDRNQFRMSLRVSSRPSDEEIAAFSNVKRILAEEFPDLASRHGTESRPALSAASVTGQQYLFSHMAPLFNHTLLTSISIAILVVTVLLMLAFRSVLIGLVTLIPNILPLVLPLAIMAVLGIPLDGPTVVVVAIALGVCVDDTIHFTTHVYQRLRQGDPLSVALRRSATTVGNALLWTSIILALGFGVLTQAGFRPNIMTGYLGTSMVVLAWVMDMVVTPAVLMLVGGRLASKSVRTEPSQVKALDSSLEQA